MSRTRRNRNEKQTQHERKRGAIAKEADASRRKAKAAAYSSRPYRRALGYFIVPNIALITEYRKINGAMIHTSGCIVFPPFFQRASRFARYRL